MTRIQVVLLVVAFVILAVTWGVTWVETRDELDVRMPGRHVRRRWRRPNG